MSITPEERARERQQSDEKARRREAVISRIKDIVWTALIASVITIIVVTTLGWLTTQAVVEKARADGARELVALRSSICLIQFQLRPDAEAKLAEFEALPSAERNAAVRAFVTAEGLATMLGEEAPAEGAVDRCADAIRRS